MEDENQNSTYNQPIKPPPDEMRVEITLKHSLCVLVVGFNDTLTQECDNHTRVLTPKDSLLEAFRRSFVKLFGVNDERLTNMTFVSYVIINESAVVSTTRDDEFDKHDEQNKPPAAARNSSTRVILKRERKEVLTFTFDIKGVKKFFFFFFFKLLKNFLNCFISLIDMKSFPGETRETIVLFYQLTLYTLDKRYFNVAGHQAFITDAIEVKQNTEDGEGWCEGPDEEKRICAL